MEFLLGVAVIGAVWIYFSMRSKVKAATAFNAIDWAEKWFTQQGINPASVMFSSYDDPALARNAGAVILVGDGKNAAGDSIGFVVEVMPRRGVVAGEILRPSGVATWHRQASLTAASSGKPLMDVLVAAATAHRAKYGQS